MEATTNETATANPSPKPWLTKDIEAVITLLCTYDADALESRREQLRSERKLSFLVAILTAGMSLVFFLAATAFAERLWLFHPGATDWRSLTGSLLMISTACKLAYITWRRGTDDAATYRQTELAAAIARHRSVFVAELERARPTT